MRSLFRVLMGIVFVCLGSLAGAQPLRVAVVGLEHGHVAELLKELPYQNEVELVGIVDADAALSRRYQGQFHLDPSLFYPGMESMITARHPQALLVYTSTGQHRQIIEAAAKRGLSVMVEKPLTVSLQDALAIRKVARERHIQVLVNYKTTWDASNRAVYDELRQGKLGDLRKIVFYGGNKGPKGIGVPPEFLKWIEDPAQNGAGVLFDFGCYGADLVTWLMRGEAPLSVTAVAQTDEPNLNPRVDDDATIILRYPKAQAVLLPSWTYPFRTMALEVYGASGYAITVVGSDRLRLRLPGHADETGMTAPPLAPPNDGSLHYLAAVLKGSLVSRGDLTSLDTNVTVMQILDAAKESVREGRTIKLAPLPE